MRSVHPLSQSSSHSSHRRLQFPQLQQDRRVVRPARDAGESAESYLQPGQGKGSSRARRCRESEGRLGKTH
jgi:hypothetical protein